jgi:glutaredoxin
MSGQPPTRRSWLSLAVLLLIVVGGTQAWSWWQDAQSARLIKQFAKPGSITLYSTVSCFYCVRARHWLKDHDIAWRECDVETDAACARTFQMQGAPGTPLVLANGHWHLGFEPAWLAQALQRPAP